MNRSLASRRSFLAAAGTGLVAAVAGCAEPGAQVGSSPGNSSTGVSPGDGTRADGSAYSAVYDAVIESVAMVTVTGVGSPIPGVEGEGQGSAFVYDDGYVVTNEHVVWGADSIELQFPSGDWSGAEIVGTDVYSDLAVLEFDRHPEPADPLAFTDALPAVGQEVLAVGNPYGFEGSMSRGIVSGVNRSLPGPANFDIPNVVQTDAGVNPGNSGGPLVDLDGNVAGVINAGVSESVGFAISAALGRRVVPTLIEDGEYEHARMGIEFREVDPVVAQANDLTEATGILVVSTPDDGAAAGVLEGSDGTTVVDGEEVPVGGDVVVELAGEPVPDHHALSRILALGTGPGEVVDVTVRRDGERVTESLELGARPTDPPRPY